MQLHSYRHIFVRIKIETIYLLILYIAMKNENPALEKYAVSFPDLARRFFFL